MSEHAHHCRERERARLEVAKHPERVESIFLHMKEAGQELRSRMKARLDAYELILEGEGADVRRGEGFHVVKWRAERC